jgi:hypothetical protein
MSAQAASSGWLTGPQLQQYMNNVNSAGGLPTAITCKPAVAGKGSVLFKVTTGNNKRQKAWQWLWADNAKFRKADHTYSRAGYTLTSHETLRVGQSRSKFDCGIWQRYSWRYPDRLELRLSSAGFRPTAKRL